LNERNNAMKFYFTFGSSETQPYYGGWVEVIAENRNTAYEKFRAKHPDHDGSVNCAFVYSQDEWDKTGMAKAGSNLGNGCHEIIE